MAKGLGPVFFTACGVVMAGLIGYGILQSQNKGEIPLVETQVKVEQSETEKASEAASANADEETTNGEAKPKKTIKLSKLLGNTSKKPKDNDAKSEEEVASVSAPSVYSKAVKSEDAAEKQVQPVFDVVRIERDGNAVIAGKALPKSKVILMDKSKVLAKTTSNNSGEFVIVLDTPLAPGGHELFLRSEDMDGTITSSKSFAFVDIPKRGEIGDVTVLLAEAGKATKLLQKPEVEIAEAKPVDDAKEEEEVASLDAGTTTSQPEETAVAETPKKEEPVVADVKPVLIEAADIETGKIYIAGTGEPEKMVTLYFENAPLGSVRIADNGSFLFEGQRDIKAGRYAVRADMTEPGSTTVLARAEVSLLHEPKVASVTQEPEPKSEPAPQEETAAATEPEKEPEPDQTQDQQQEVASSEPSQEAAKPETDEAQQVINEDEPETTENTEEQKPEIITGSAVIIRRGDSLWTVARRNYGAGIRYTTIFDANRDQIRNPHRIFPGQVLKIPEKQDQEGEAQTN